MTGADGYFPHSFPGSESDRFDDRAETRAPTMALRSGVSLLSLLPDADVRSVPLTGSGSYLIVAISGHVGIDSGPSPIALPSQALTVWRAGLADVAAELRHGRGAAAVAVHFPESWYRSCPRGPNCQIGEFLMRGGEPPVQQHPLELDADGEAIAQRLLRTSLHHDADLLIAERDVLGLLSWAFRRHTADVSAPAPDETVPSRHLAKLRQARQLLCRRQSNPPTVPELAQLVGLNEFDLKRYFKAHYACSVAQYSRQQRLKTAQNLLELSARSIADVALDVGFQNPSQFARAFRRHFGINPGEHRRANA